MEMMNVLSGGTNELVCITDDCKHVQVTYDTEHSPKACSPHALRAFLSELVQVPQDHLCMAKHKMEMFQWIPIEDSFVQVRISNHCVL